MTDSYSHDPYYEAPYSDEQIAENLAEHAGRPGLRQRVSGWVDSHFGPVFDRLADELVGLRDDIAQQERDAARRQQERS